MSKGNIVRAWKDAVYRQSLSAEEQALLPEHPAGSIELAEEDLKQVAGGLTFVCTVYTLCGQSTCGEICNGLSIDVMGCSTTLIR